MIPVRLNWLRPRDGVSIDEDGDIQLDSDMRVLRPRSERSDPVTYYVQNLENPVALHFINCAAADDFVAFISRFGMLDTLGTPAAWSNMNGMRATKDDIVEIFELSNYSNSVAKAQHVNNLLKYVRFRPIFECSAAGTNQLVLEPGSLGDLMMIEAAFAVEAGTSLARCAHCSKAYLTGPMTGRRSHAVYCSDRCRVAAMRARNAAKGKSPERF